MNRAQRRASRHKRDQRHTPTINGVATLIQTISRALPHTEALEFGNLRIETSPLAERSKTEVRAALTRLQSGNASVKDFDDLSHEIAIVGLRMLDIGGTDDSKNNLKLIYEDACAALNSCRKRYLRWGKFELLSAESNALQDGIDAWEVILDASSPKQMNDASATYVRWIELNKMKKD